jgi:hypothetical protein
LVVPLWINFENFPIHLFDKFVLFSIASAIQKPLKINEVTTNLMKLDVAWVCIEVDLLKSNLRRL